MGRATVSLAALVLGEFLLEDLERAQVDRVGGCVPQNGGPQALEGPSEAIVREGRPDCSGHSREGRCALQDINVS